MVEFEGNVYKAPFLKQSIQTIGRSYSKRCPKCNSDKFDVVMNYMLGNNGHETPCASCRRQAKFLKQLFRGFFSYFKIDQNTVKQIYGNVKLRKTIKNYLKGQAIFGPRKPFVMGAPLSVVWNVTDNCNLKCSHCFVDAKFNKKSNSELTTLQAKKVIRMLAANDVVTVNFCGGEPLMREDIYELMSYANDNYLYPSLSTNATLMNKSACQKIYDSGVRTITISLDSISAKNHDRLRKVEGAYDLAINGIKNAVEFGKFKDIIISTTMTDYNYTEISQIYELIKGLGATKFYVGRLIPNGRGKNYIEHDPDKEIKKQILEELAQKLIRSIRSEDEIQVITRGMPYFSKTCYELSNGTIYPLCELITGYESELLTTFNNRSSNLVHKLSSILTGCAAGLFYIGLSSDGQIQPCATSSHIRLGNILEQGLHDIWVNNPILNNIRNRRRKTGKCATCESKKYCGGCLISAFNSTGDWHGSDLSCPY